MKKLFQNKIAVFAILGLALGIVLILLGSTSDDDPTITNDINHPEYSTKELESYTSSLEAKVQNILSKIGGVADVSVVITVEGSIENVYATEGANKDYVIIKDPNGHESPVQIMEINATVRGIAVVCDYGNDERLKGEIINMLASLFNIGANRIFVISA